MRTTVAVPAAAVLAAALNSAHHCAQAFIVSAPVTSGGGSTGNSASLRSRSWETATRASTSAQRAPREGLTGLSMVSATFGEKINTDKIVLDKTAREAITELYPEACAKNPQFLGEEEKL